MEEPNIKLLKIEADALAHNIEELEAMCIPEGSKNWKKRRERRDRTIEAWQLELEDLRDQIYRLEN